jgi:hypothetical protein
LGGELSNDDRKGAATVFELSFCCRALLDPNILYAADEFPVNSVFLFASEYDEPDGDGNGKTGEDDDVL